MDIKNNNKVYNSDKTIKYSCQYHVIFCPKFRRKVLKNKIDVRLKELIFQKQKDYNYNIQELEVMEDHVHLLIECSPKIGIHKVVKMIKGYSSNILRKEFKKLTTSLPCLWTRSYFISTVGTVSLEVVKKYIETQKGK